MKRKASVLALLLIVGALLASSCASAAFQGTPLDPPEPASNFTLADQFGKDVSLSDFKGKLVVLTFLFTNCTDVCPLTTEALRQAYDQLGDDTAKKVQLIAITVDPQRDTVEQVHRYSESRGMLDKWRFLVGTEEELAPIWKEYYVGPVTFQENGSDAEASSSTAGMGHTSGVTSQDYSVNHEAPVYLIDAKGNRRVVIVSLLSDPAPLLHDIRLFLR